MTNETHYVRRVDVPAGRYEPHASLGSFATLAAAEAEAEARIKAAATRYTPSIYEVRHSRTRKLVRVFRNV